MRQVWLSLVALLALAGWAAPARAAWLPGAQIDGTGGATHAVALGMAPDDASAVLAWVATDPDSTHTRLDIAVLQAGAWVSKGAIDTASGDVTKPSAAMVGGSGVVTWLQSDGDHVRLWAVAVAGGTVGAPQAIDQGTKDVHADGVAITSTGTAVVGYIQYIGSRERVLANTAAVGVWGTPTYVDVGAGTSNAMPTIAVSGAGDGVGIAFIQGDGSGLLHAYEVRRSAAALWSGAVQLDAGAGDGNVAEISLAVVADGRAVASWTQYLGGRRRVYAGVESGGVWSIPLLLDPTVGGPGDVIPTGDAFTPSVSADGVSGSAVVVWSQASSSRKRVFSARMTGWATWQASTPIDDPAGADSTSPFVAIAAPSGDGVAAWYGWNVTDQQFHIYVAVLAAGVWLAAQDVGVADGAPIIGVNSLGQRIAIWINGATVIQAYEDTVPPTAALRDCILLAGHAYSFILTATDPGGLACDDPGPGTFLALATDDHGVERAAWDFGDGTTATTVPAVHTYHKGSYPLTLNVWDAAGNTGGASSTLTVVDRDGPVLSAGPDQRVEVGQQMTFTADPIDAESGVDAASVRWTFSDDPTPHLGASVTRTFPAAGAVTATISASDLNAPTANSSSDSAVITVVEPTQPAPPGNLRAVRNPTNQPPALAWDGVFNADHYDVYRGSGSPAGTVSAPLTSWTDASSTAEGSYTYHLVAVSARSRVSAQTPDVVIVVDLTPPSARLPGEIAGEVGRSVHFDLRASETVTGVTWDFADATAGSGSIADHAYALPGVYPVTVHFADLAGNAAAAATTVTIASALTVDAGPNVSARVGDVVRLRGAASSPAAITSWSWNLGDGTTLTGQSISYRFTRPGSYHVVLTVGDAASHVATDDLWAEVAVRYAPIVTAKGPSKAFVGDRVLFRATSKPGQHGVTIRKNVWTFGDKGRAVGLKVRHAFRTSGAFIVYFTATDSKKRRARARVDITLRRLKIRATRATQARGRVRLAVIAGSRGTVTVVIGKGRKARVIKVKLRRSGASTITLRVGHRLAHHTRLVVTLTRSQGARARTHYTLP